MGLLTFLKKKRIAPSPQSTTSLEIYKPAIKAELIEHDKEVVVVKQVTLEDMKQFLLLPFKWNSEVKKVIGPSTKPYAYMDIIDENTDIVLNQLENMNVNLSRVHHLSALIPMTLQIPTRDVLIEPRAQGSYSKIMCTPHTFTGRISRYPASLHFMTELHVPDIDTTHGELFYDRYGRVAKAKICFWRSGVGFFVHFQMINEKLAISKIESTIIDDHGLPNVIYKAP